MIRAINMDDPDQMARYRTPGSFRLERRQDPRLFELLFLCPCGCGTEQRILVGRGFKPGGQRPSWNWNGSRSEPTLEPSVNIEGHWHGWLRDGYWEVC